GFHRDQGHSFPPLYSTLQLVDSSEGITVEFDMAPNSVDDSYGHCGNNMLQKVTYLLSAEKMMNANFAKAWSIAEKYSVHTEKDLPHLHRIAIYTYTMGYVTPPFYQTFNKAVRNWQSHTLASFPYKSEHFLLTDAIWMLKRVEVRNKKPRCVTTYRGTSLIYKKAEIGREFRFGAFTSSSTSKTVAQAFGNKTCFIIRTCFGANITPYSAFKNEAEVLIPPYEKFKVTKVSSANEIGSMFCDVTYTVKSSGFQSTRVCSWVDQGSF
uniref:NAD(P)(+)--arginine ADP-ribosyltransferase n=1 Tax=Scleropages formosus TaxID=113540 RepID=A0A8C9RK33_SCLFO